MPSLSTKPIVILDDDEDVIMIDNDSDDEMEILEYSCPGPTQTSPTTTPSSRSCSSLDPATGEDQVKNTLPDSLAKDAPQSPTSLSTVSSASAAHASASIDMSLKACTIHSRTPSGSSDSPRPSENLPASSNSSTPSVSGPTFGASPPGLQISEDLWEIQQSRSGSFDPIGMTDTMGPGTVIDLDELEDCDPSWQNEMDLQILRVERKTSRRNSSTPAIPKRNLPITAPCVELEHYQYNNMGLRRSKTVEIDDGDFLVITNIISKDPASTTDITLRGHRLQRCRSMNGILEKKLNEVCYFYEVDLDDPRLTYKQSAIEVSLNEVKGLRTVRKTNQMFPIDRNLDLGDFLNPQDAEMNGGLTVRWKYSCTYASAEDRRKNSPKERALEFLRENECSKGCGSSDENRRLDWRGETVPGGAYIPKLENEKQAAGAVRRESVISLASSTSEIDSDFIIIDSPPTSLEAESPVTKAQSVSFSLTLPVASRKRRASSSEDLVLQEPSRRPSKRGRLGSLELVELTRQDMDDLYVDGRPSISRDECLEEKLDASSLGQLRDIPSISTQRNQTPLSRHAPSLGIDLSSSDLSSPPSSGSIVSDTVSAKIPVIRPPGQMLTYGDAFCGAGGTSRGAVMAGLRIKWGFDHWNHACSTWRTNFPQAKCYQMWSDEFVRTVRGSKNINPIDSKVDILHLSPPCQYFSPAHTVDCPYDEVNVASLYAVGDVIKISKPRVVTLEQTFGLVAAKFRKYFNSLIQMFTALGFSLRWSVVNFAQWGLPQRRHRLIIIAACPGELLPTIPLPTHSDSSSDPSILPLATVNHTLSQITQNAPNHNINAVLWHPSKYQTPWDGNSILPRSMTTHGGQNYHPSGERDFTLREYAALQGFPPNHVFAGFAIKKQIGNAVPPPVAKVLFESIKRQLDEADGVVKSRETLVID